MDGRRKLLIGLGAAIIVPKRSFAKTIPTTFNLAGLAVDASATTWKAAVVGNGGTVSDARLALVSTMIAGLKTDGVWASLSRLWSLAAENAVSALTDMTAAHDLATFPSLAPNFTTDRGYDSAGSSNKKIGTTFNGSTDALAVRNSTHAMLYCNAFTGATGISFFGSAYEWYTPYVDTNFYTRINGGSGGYAGTNTGCIIGSRTSSVLTTTYNGGSSIGTDSTASSAPVNTALQFLADASTNRIAAVSLGAGLSGAQAAALTTRLTTYLTAIGAQ